MEIRECRTCEWRSYGFCNYNPPVVVVVKGKIEYFRPLVDENSFCSKYWNDSPAEPTPEPHTLAVTEVKKCKNVMYIINGLCSVAGRRCVDGTADGCMHYKD